MMSERERAGILTYYCSQFAEKAMDHYWPIIDHIAKSQPKVQIHRFRRLVYKFESTPLS